MNRLRALASFSALALALAGCDRAGVEADRPMPPPRHFMHGGVWYPAATGYWFHQFATDDDLDRLMPDLGFTCAEESADGEKSLRCERGFRWPGGLLSRTDTTTFTFRTNGAIASAASSCRFEVLGFAGTCAPFAARGAVYPDIEAFTKAVEAMLRPASRVDRVMSESHFGAGAAMVPAASVAGDRLAQWRFECDTPRQHSRSGFRGEQGATHEMRCQQWSLRTPAGAPQSQRVVVRYDSVKLAVLTITAELDGATATLPASLHARADAVATREGATAAPASSKAPAASSVLVLETVAGERFEMPISAVGSGGTKASRDGFATLTPASQRELLQVYLDKRQRDWPNGFKKLSAANLFLDDWFGPGALPHVETLITDDRPELGAALVKALCFEAIERREATRADDRLAEAMATCVDERRAAMPRSLEAMDRLLAADLRPLAANDARFLDGSHDFRRYIAYVYALRIDGREASLALEELAASKALEPNLAGLVARAINQRDQVPPR